MPGLAVAQGASVEHGWGSATRAVPRQVLPGLRCEGGGTDFRPLLAEGGRHRPSLVVVLTDLDCPAGDRPPWPVIWAVPIARADAVAPFGRTLRLA